MIKQGVRALRNIIFITGAYSVFCVCISFSLYLYTHSFVSVYFTEHFTVLFTSLGKLGISSTAEVSVILARGAGRSDLIRCLCSKLCVVVFEGYFDIIIYC